MFTCEKSCPGNYLFAQVVIPDFEGGDELKESSEVKGSLGPTGFRSAQTGRLSHGVTACHKDEPLLFLSYRLVFLL